MTSDSAKTFRFSVHDVINGNERRNCSIRAPAFPDPVLSAFENVDSKKNGSVGPDEMMAGLVASGADPKILKIDWVSKTQL